MSKMNEEKIALRVAANSFGWPKGPTILQDLIYCLSVVQKKIPTFQNYATIVNWLEQANSRLTVHKKKIISKIGEGAYKELVRVFDDYEKVWTKIGKAEKTIENGEKEIEKLNSKHKDAADVLYSTEKR